MMTQNSTDYRPTVKERNLLDVLLNPEHRLKSISEICTITGCDRKVYYRAFGKPEFVAFYTAESRNLVKKSLGPIINACINHAIRGSALHAKIVLTMAGAYTENQKISFPDENGKTQHVGTIFSDLERANRLLYLLNLAEKRQAEAEAEYMREGVT